MFTGLIEEVGRLRKLERRSEEAILELAASFAGELADGESVAVNGACLTVAERGAGYFRAFASPETLARTNLGELGPGAAVNLERALRLDGRLGGHLVTGHIDGVGAIADLNRRGSAWLLAISYPAELAPYIVEKGSIAIDGISLTVNAVSAGGCEITIIPHTAARTNLAGRRNGERINIETDLIGKYVRRFLAGDKPQAGSGLSLDFLAEHGFAGRKS